MRKEFTIPYDPSKSPLARANASLPWVHLHIPKTAGSWVEQNEFRLPYYEIIHDGGHRTPNQKTKDLVGPFAHIDKLASFYIQPGGFAESWRQANWFSILRNPFDWLCSYYYHRKRGEGGVIDNGWAKCNDIHKFKSFEEFVEAYCDPGSRWSEITEIGTFWNWHVPTLHKFYTAQTFDENGVCVINAFLYYETINESLKELFPGIHPTGFHKSTNNYKDHYTPRLRDLAEKRFEPECRIYGYNFDGRTDNRLLHYPDRTHRYDMFSNRHWHEVEQNE